MKKLTSEGVPTVEAALRAIIAEQNGNEEAYHRISVRLLASGEVAYRMHKRDEELYTGGVLTIAKPPNAGA